MPAVSTLVLHNHGDSVQGPLESLGVCEGLVERPRLLGCACINRHDRVDRGALLVIGLDTGQIAVHEIGAGDFSRAIGGVNRCDGGFFELE
jgi:hypothetical protein